MCNQWMKRLLMCDTFQFASGIQAKPNCFHTLTCAVRIQSRQISCVGWLWTLSSPDTLILQLWQKWTMNSAGNYWLHITALRLVDSCCGYRVCGKLIRAACGSNRSGQGWGTVREYMPRQWWWIHWFICFMCSVPHHVSETMLQCLTP